MASAVATAGSSSVTANTINIGFKTGAIDPLGIASKERIDSIAGVSLDDVRLIRKFTLDLGFSEEEAERIATERFTDHIVDEVTINEPIIPGDFNWAIEVGFKPGVKDNSGDAAFDVIKKGDGKVYSSEIYLLKGKGLTESDVARVAGRVLSNDQVQQFRIMPYEQYLEIGAEPWLPKVESDHVPKVDYIDIFNMDDDELVKLSKDRSLALVVREMKKIQSYFAKPEVREARKKAGMSALPSDVEIEKLAQGWSEHCKHKIFNAKITYKDMTAGGHEEIIDSIFNTYIKEPTRAIQEEKPWIVSALSDNAGVIEFAPGWYFAYKVETHNSPSNVEPFGGSITGIVGVFRDPMGTGQGGRVCCGFYQFSVGYPDYEGEFMPKIHPRQLLAEVIRGIRHGGNKEGVPTVDGSIHFHKGHMAKCAIHVGAGAVIPAEVNGKPGWYKKAEKCDRIVMAGGLIGKDGIHGATQSSLEHGKWISTTHVQMGDPYTQKNVQDFILEARNLNLFNSITDNGAGGLSSSVGEMAEETGGCVLDITHAPLKYPGMDPWEILLSESQERMTLAVPEEKMEELRNLAKKHNVVMSDLGEFTDTGYFQVLHEDKTVAYMEMKFMNDGVPQMELEAVWEPPNLVEPKIASSLSEVGENSIFFKKEFHGDILKAVLSNPNVASSEYAQRLFDHEVQGGSVGPKHFVGKMSDVEGDAVAFAPVLELNNGIIEAHAINPEMSEIDTYDMTKYVITQAITKVIATGGDIDNIVLCGNFCHPSPLYDEKNNPDGKYKAAQLIRSGKALKECAVGYGTADFTGKDSMSMDGRLTNSKGEEQRDSAQPTFLASAIGRIEDISDCITMNAKRAGDLVYIVGVSSDEFGASEFYDSFGFRGKNAPKVDIEEAKKNFRAISRASGKRLLASAHGVYSGLAPELAKVAFAGGLGMEVNLGDVPSDIIETSNITDVKILYSKSAARFILTAAPEDRGAVESALSGCNYACVGKVTEEPHLKVMGVGGDVIITENIYELKDSYKKPFGKKGVAS